MLQINYYKVGGAVRDQLLGREPKDIDFVCVVSGEDDVGKAYNEMKYDLMASRLIVRTESPQFGTLRATGTLVFAGKLHEGTFDFVLARRDVGGVDGRHPERVEVGTLEDDLRRRDFTINAMAQNNAGNIIDLFDGREDLDYEIINTVGDARQRFDEDRLRVIRALRFAVTFNFTIGPGVDHALGKLCGDPDALRGVSQERVREELDKMFRVNGPRSMWLLEHYGLIGALPGKLWFKPTLEAR